jgi:hypothetical protein
MIIDVSVRDDEYHKDAYISEVVFDTQDTFVPEIGTPSAEWVAKRPVDAADYVAKIAWEVKKVDEYFDIVCHHSPCMLHHHHHSHCGCHANKDDTSDNELIVTANAENEDSTVPEVLDRTKVKHARIEIKQEDLCKPFEDTMFFVWIKCEGVAPDAPCSLNKTYTLGVCVNYFNIYRRFICLMRELLKDCDIPKYFIDLWMRWKAVQMAIATGNYLEAILLWKRFFLFKHQRPLYEQPQYMRFWADWHKDGILPEANYAHPVYGFGGSLFNFTGGSCRTCRR